MTFNCLFSGEQKKNRTFMYDFSFIHVKKPTATTTNKRKKKSFENKIKKQQNSSMFNCERLICFI